MTTDEIIIRGETATVNTPDGKSVTMSLRELFEQAVPPRIDSCGIRLPHEVRFAYSRGGLLILACEYPPGPYTLSWIAEDSPAPFGSQAKYENVTLSLPYVIVLAAFEGDSLVGLQRVFLPHGTADRDRRGKRAVLSGPAELLALRATGGQTVVLDLHAEARSHADSPREGFSQANRCWSGSVAALSLPAILQLSSDHHEYSSWYSESRGVDERISTAARWHEETIKDRYMGLDIPWLKTNETLKSVVERIFRNKGLTTAGSSNARQLARLMINNTK